MKLNVSYVYVNPCGAGPYRGKTTLIQDTKPIKGDTIHAVMGQGVITSVSRAKGKV